MLTYKQQYGAKMTRVSYSSVFFEPTRSWKRSTSTNHAVFLRTRLPIVHTLYYYFVVMYVRYRHIIYSHPLCSLPPFFSILTYKHPGSQSMLFDPLPACPLCLGFILREEFSPSLHLYTLVRRSQTVDLIPYILLYILRKSPPHPSWDSSSNFNAENRGDTQDHRGAFAERNRNQC